MNFSVSDISCSYLSCYFSVPETFNASLCNRTLACEELEHNPKLIQRMPFLEKTLNTQKEQTSPGNDSNRQLPLNQHHCNHFGSLTSHGKHEILNRKSVFIWGQKCF
ncbi:hypothetical protein CDAR_577141 [Caerostris darwini]|uniref:Uncharacterized protein n=1 Tax=Caerostris darwini TaxID=1538125 RepID=A0AAV4UGA4_9ARAC|nr:hypothetical protein CDAR_577141 [Caerostris darwini]